jgi:hypothetical protein
MAAGFPYKCIKIKFLLQPTRQRSREYAIQLICSFQTPKFQLAEHIQKRESSTPAIPSHIAFKDWKA